MHMNKCEVGKLRVGVVSIDIIRYGASIAAALAIRIIVVFKIPDAPAHRRTVRDFEARSAMLVNASNIAIFSWGASHPMPLETPPFIRGSTADFSFSSCSRVYLRDRIRKQMTGSFFYLFPELVLFFFSLSLSLIRVYSYLESNGNTDRIQIICEDILT